MSDEPRFQLEVSVTKVTPREGTYPEKEILMKLDVECDPIRAMDIFLESTAKAIRPGRLLHPGGLGMTLTRSPLKRTGSLKRRKSFRKYEGQDEFRQGVWRLSIERDCPVLRAYSLAVSEYASGNGPKPEALTPHHIVTKEKLADAGLALLAAEPENGMLLTRKAHAEHHSRKRPIPYSQLPQCAIDFAAELGFSDWIERTYPS